MMLFCPVCGHSLEQVQIKAEPMTDPSRLGMAVLACFHCQLICHTESVLDKTPFVAVANLHKIDARVNLKLTLAIYEDLLSLIEPFIQWILQATPQHIPNKAKHKLSSLYVYLHRLRSDIKTFRDNLKKANP